MSRHSQGYGEEYCRFEWFCWRAQGTLDPFSTSLSSCFLSKFKNGQKQAKNVETGQLVEKLRSTVATKDALIESLKQAINKNEKQAEKVRVGLV